MKNFLLSKDNLLKNLNSDSENGLSKDKVEKSRQEFGINEFSKVEKETVIQKIFQALKDPMVLILLAATFISIGINVYKLIMGEHTEFSESVGIIFAVILSIGIQIIMEGKSAKAFEELNNINDDIKVKAIRDGHIKYILKKELAVGDIVLIETGDKIPADGRLLESVELQLDESMLTGESEHVKKDSESIFSDEKIPLAERNNMVYGGSFVTTGRGKFAVTEIGDNTEMGTIANELKNSGNSPTPLQEKLSDLAKKISFLAAIIAFMIFAFQCYKLSSKGILNFQGIQEAFMTSIALIVACVPEGLPTIVAMIFAFNIVKMAKNNALVKKMVACETIGATNVICSDKTGTLTENKMTLIKVWDNGSIKDAKDLNDKNLINNFAINSTANLQILKEKQKFIGNPTECSLLQGLYKIDKDYNEIRNNVDLCHQYPFSSEKKSMSTVIKNKNEQIIGYSKGSPEKIISFCKWIKVNGKLVSLNDEIKSNIEAEIESLQSKAYRIIGFSHRILDNELDWESNQDLIENDMIYDGFVAIADPLRDEVFSAVQKCKKAGISLKILTGDNIVTATAIAKQLNVLKENSLILEANEIDEMSDEELIRNLNRIVVIARSKPITKMRVVNLLKSTGNVVAVTGDGINDAPALKNADVGIAMGINGTEVSKEASDIVLLDDSFSTIVKSIEWGRGIYQNLQRFLQFQLTVNLVAVLTIILSELFGFDLPFTPVQLLWVNIIMDGPPALSLGLENLRKNLMDKTPIKRNESIITKNMLFRIVANGIYMVIMILALKTFNFLGGTPLQHSTIVFSVFVLFQLFNAFNSRELDNDSIIKCLFNNKIMILSVTVMFIAQVLITQFAGGMFEIVPLEFDLWMKVILFSSTIVIYSEAVKLVSKIFSKVTEVEYQ